MASMLSGIATRVIWLAAGAIVGVVVLIVRDASGRWR